MAETIVMLDPRALKVHPRNDEFFDDAVDEAFDRLVESVKLHGVLTPVRVTKDLTLISGKQRTRAAIAAERFSIPAIVDETEDDDEILMKLIETNFGRMKNDPIKQAKWIEEYMKLKGVQVGSGRPKKGNNSPFISQEDIASELGVDVSTLKNLKSLLTLDPAIQQLISDGTISPTTGFKLIAKLSPDDQRKLLDKLSDDVKFSAKTIVSKINEIRAEGAANTNEVQRENSELRGRNERLIKENNELRNGVISSDGSREKIAELEDAKRDYYEKYIAAKKEIERLRSEMDKAIQAKALAESKAKGGDDAAIAMQNRIDELEAEIKKVERERDDLDYQLTEKEDEISSLMADKKDGAMRSAITPDFTEEEYTERMLISFKTKVIQSITSFETAVNEIMKDINMLNSLEHDTVRALREVSSKAIQSAKMLYEAMLCSSDVVDNTLEHDVGDDYDDEPWTEDDMIVSGKSA